MSTPPDRSGDEKRRPLVSPALMRALTEVKGMSTEDAINHVDGWNSRFKGADRVVAPSKNKDNFNRTNAFGD